MRFLGSNAELPISALMNFDHETNFYLKINRLVRMDHFSFGVRWRIANSRMHAARRPAEFLCQAGARRLRKDLLSWRQHHCAGRLASTDFKMVSATISRGQYQPNQCCHRRYWIGSRRIAVTT